MNQITLRFSPLQCEPPDNRDSRLASFTVSTMPEVAPSGSKESGQRNVPLPDLYEATVVELQLGLDAGNFTSVDLVKVVFDIQTCGADDINGRRVSRHTSLV